MSWTPISRAYVFTLPSTEAQSVPVGIVEANDSGYRFAYAQSWLNRQDSYSLDPLNLPLGPGEFTSSKLWGALTDAGADKWGRKLMLATHKQAPANEIEWLLATKGAGVGALIFSASRTHPPEPSMPPQFKELETLITEITSLLKGNLPEHLAADILKAFEHGSSMGGARPKFTVAAEGAEWLCKVSEASDTFNQPVAESACLSMAADCGIQVPEHRVFAVGGSKVLMVKRFDRVDGERLHYLSAYALINPQRVSEREAHEKLSYANLARIIDKVSVRPEQDRHELFVRMVLNIAVGNTDDHSRNHGFLHCEGERYRLAPAFDVLPHPTQTALQALSVGLNGREGSLANALSAAPAFGLSDGEARAIIDQVLSVTQRAADHYQAAGANQLDAGILHNISYQKRQQWHADDMEPDAGTPSPSMR